MEFIKKLLGMGTSKPFKIQNVTGGRRIGVTASDLDDLRKKASLKLGIKTIGSIVLEEDGTEIDDSKYFESLAPQTVIVILKPGEVWEGYITYLKLASIKIIDNSNFRKDMIEKFHEFVDDLETPELSLLMEYVSVASANIEGESREEDPSWFEGLPNAHKAKRKKNQVMKELAKGRIRGYLGKTKEYAGSTVMSKNVRSKLYDIIRKFETELHKNGYYAAYFDRLADQDENKLCCDKGWFECQGPFNRDSCRMIHKINPYASKETRILFSTWNLDHRIEKSREVLPKLVEFLGKCPKNKELNWRYFYELLFTRKNLKLVDIRCHDKSKHTDYIVDQNIVYIDT